MIYTAFLFSTIMFGIGCAMIFALKSQYFSTYRKINSDFINDNSKKSMPSFDMNINSSFAWNCAVSVVLIFGTMTYDYFYKSRDFQLEQEVSHMYEQLDNCRDKARIEVLKELKMN